MSKIEPPCRRPRDWLVVLIGLSLLFASGCAFEGRWREAAAREPLGEAASAIEGRWAGTWQSDGNFHSGGLRCIVKRRGEGSDAYAAEFHATYAWILQFGYAMTITAHRVDGAADGEVAFVGAADLGGSPAGSTSTTAPSRRPSSSASTDRAQTTAPSP